jgi:hypothetical protein
MALARDLLGAIGPGGIAAVLTDLVDAPGAPFQGAYVSATWLIMSCGRPAR